MLENYTEIQKYLFDVYYQNFENYSDVTSSHWRKIGKHKVKTTESGLQLIGSGFGNKVKNNFFRKLYYFPEFTMINWLLNKYLVNREYVSYGKAISKLQNTMFNYDCVRQILSVDYLIRNIDYASLSTRNNNINISNSLSKIAIIGDGYGYTACLLKKIFPNTLIVSINIGRTLLFDVFYTRKVFPDSNVGLVSDNNDINIALDSGLDFLFIEAENYDLLNDIDIDLYINIASMQEMNLFVIYIYIEYMRNCKGAQPYFYCCNREEKKLPDSELVRYKDYGWNQNDEIFFDELCPWYQKYPYPIPPFWRKFDGPIRHRLTRLAKE